MSVFAICASHTPLKDHLTPAPAIVAACEQQFSELRARVADFDPELVLVFGPDHFNGFFHRLMPAFCLGADSVSLGDWHTPSGPLPGASRLAVAATAQALEEGVDLALSWRMELDHGLTQTLQMLFDWTQLPPVLPVFINCIAPPRPPFARVEALGRVLGRFAGSLGQRVLIVGSGGLSHDPPVPSLTTASPEVRERLIAGGAMSAEARAARQQRIIDDARQQVDGASSGVPLNPDWDRAFLATLVAQDFAQLRRYEDDAITTLAGRGGHEVRCWVAVAAAMAALDAAPPRIEWYQPIPEWVAGFGVLTQGPV